MDIDTTLASDKLVKKMLTMATIRLTKVQVRLRIRDIETERIVKGGANGPCGNRSVQRPVRG